MSLIIILVGAAAIMSEGKLGGMVDIFMLTYNLYIYDMVEKNDGHVWVSGIFQLSSTPLGHTVTRLNLNHFTIS